MGSSKKVSNVHVNLPISLMNDKARIDALGVIGAQAATSQRAASSPASRFGFTQPQSSKTARPSTVASSSRGPTGSTSSSSSSGGGQRAAASTSTSPMCFGEPSRPAPGPVTF